MRRLQPTSHGTLDGQANASNTSHFQAPVGNQFSAGPVLPRPRKKVHAQKFFGDVQLGFLQAQFHPAGGRTQCSTLARRCRRDTAQALRSGRDQDATTFCPNQLRGVLRRAVRKLANIEASTKVWRCPSKLRPTGLGSGIDKDRPDYTVY
jgi:hypothetical protein